MAMLLITHDLAIVAKMAHRVALMYAGQIVEVADAKAFFASPLHPYAVNLFEALPDTGKRGRRLASIAGSVPPLNQVFIGCRFADRCGNVMERCRTAPPHAARIQAAPFGALRSVRRRRALRARQARIRQGSDAAARPGGRATSCWTCGTTGSGFRFAKGC